MLSPKDFWHVAYQLCGVTILGKTEQEPLGALPYPVRSALLQTVQALDASAVTIQTEERTLEYLGGSYAWVDS